MEVKTSLMLRQNIHNNRRGGIEGLPLQLMIMILVATLATAIIVGWMGNIEEPHTIGEVTVDTGSIMLEKDGNECTTTSKISINVTDQNGDPLKDATVVLSGLGIKTKDGGTVFGDTDENGTVQFPTGLKLHLTNKVGFITVDVSKPGYGEDSSCKIAAIVN